VCTQQQPQPPAGRATVVRQALPALVQYAQLSVVSLCLHPCLQQASQLYELAVYTMGDKAYAHEIARLLDPGGRLFAGRVVSAADSTHGQRKGLDVLLADPKHVLILDDTEQVWAAHRSNLIQVGAAACCWADQPRGNPASHDATVAACTRSGGQDACRACGCLSHVTAHAGRALLCSGVPGCRHTFVSIPPPGRPLPLLRQQHTPLVPSSQGAVGGREG
jgi:hypothetical protein